MDIRDSDDGYVVARPSGQALFRSGFAAAPRNPVPGFRRSGDDPSCSRLSAGMDALARGFLFLAGTEGFALLFPKQASAHLPPRPLARTFRAGGSPRSLFSPSNPPLARPREAGGACFAEQSGEKRRRCGGVGPIDLEK